MSDINLQGMSDHDLAQLATRCLEGLDMDLKVAAVARAFHDTDEREALKTQLETDQAEDDAEPDEYDEDAEEE